MKKILSLLTLLALTVCITVYAQTVTDKQPSVLFIPIKGTIDLGLSGFVKRVLAEQKNEISAYIFEIDTFGGRVDAALEICKSIKELKGSLTVAYITGEAWSAGALISLACKDIIMAPGSSIGSAEPRLNMFGSGENATDEKTVSAIRAKFKSIAEENNHPQNIAQGMVDKDIELRLVEIKGVKEIVTTEELEEFKQKLKKNELKEIRIIKQKSKLLNLSAKDAKELNLAKEIIEDRNSLFKFYNLSDSPIKEGHPNWSEILVRFITNPIVSSLLLTLGFLGMIFELKAPGWGITGTIALICLALFFWGHYLVGLANWIEILIFIAGITLLLLEIFLIPGFGLAGAMGIFLTLLGAFLALIKHPFQIPRSEITSALYILTYSLIATFGLTLLIMKSFPHTGLWKRVVLASSEKTQAGYTSAKDFSQYLGKLGETISILRPSGRAIIDGEIIDVITEGDFIDTHKVVVVTRVEGSKIFVSLEENKNA